MSFPDMLVQIINSALPHAQAAAPVRVEGWSPSTYILTAILSVIAPVASAIIYALFKYLPVMRKLRDQADGSLRSDLLKRVAEVEGTLGEARSAFDKAFNEARREFDDLLNSERRECARQLGAYQRKMDIVTRRFFQFQLSLVRYLPQEAGPSTQQALDSILTIISQPIEDFEEVDVPAAS